MANQVLLNNVSADVTSDTFKSTGGIAVINVRADSYGGGTLTIEAASSNDSAQRFVVLTNGTITTDATVKVDYLPSGLIIRAVLTGSAGASNVFVDVLQ